MTDEPIELCDHCETGFYHNYNGVWLCQFCGNPKVKEEAPRPTGRVTTARKGRKTDE